MKDGYISKYNERNYATKIRKLEKSDLPKHQNRDEIRKTTEASNCNSYVESGKEQEETLEEIIEKTYWSNYESFGEEVFIETHKEGQQRIQVPIERRSETQEKDIGNKNYEEIVKKETIKHKKHEAKESKAYEKKEDKKEKKLKKK